MRSLSEYVNPKRGKTLSVVERKLWVAVGLRQEMKAVRKAAENVAK
jgi:hypothetical protein